MANNAGQQPPSPMAMYIYHSTSPTTPTHGDHNRNRGYSLEEVHSWSEAKVAEWLSLLNYSRYRSKFIENNITGAILLDLDNEALKSMDIKTVGERVKLLVAVRSLRQECYAAIANAVRAKQQHLAHAGPDSRADYRLQNQSSISIATTQTLAASPSLYHLDGHGKHEGFNVTIPHPEKSSKSSEGKSLLNRSNSFSRFLGRADSKRSMRAGQDAPPMPPSPKNIQKRKSLEKGIMSMEKVKQTCVKVFGEEGQFRIVNVHNTSDAKAIMAKVLHKFGIDENNADRYCIFVGSSTNGEARALSDVELAEICRSVDRPEKERLILRKRHLYPTHEEFKRKGTNNWKLQRVPMQQDIDSPTTYTSTPTAESIHAWLPDKQLTLDIITGSSVDNIQPRYPIRTHSITHNQTRVRRFFGERPPSEVISSNLPSFFPNHKREMLETAGINAKRLSTTRSSSSFRRESRAAYRNSVLPELITVLGVDADLAKFPEEEDIEENSAESATDKQRQLSDDEDQIPESTTEDNPSAMNESLLEEESAETLAGKSTGEDIHKPLSPAISVKTLENVEKDEEDEDEEDDKEDPLAEMVRTKSLISDEKPLEWMKGSLIGRGTFGDVYLGLNPVSGELMAVKQVDLPVENSATEDRKKSMVEALHREIALLKELQHENIVQYLGSQMDTAHFSIFLEYVPGGSVAGLLASYGAFKEPLVQSFVRQILKGLNYLHRKDIVHRDIKGANVLVDNKGGVKISDFGISKKVEENILQVSSAPNRPSLQGSIFWMAPEVVKQTHYTRKADVWSLGCMVVEMFTGDHPFPEFTQMQAIFKIGSYTAPNIPEHISEDAKDFLRCTFKLNHEERPCAKELLEHSFLKI
ncbi:kinase-like domain-containing protein [Dichotomocladium elegans]|nr:kinase-like domain-containing protein [Dichotomocladium elegans]